MKFEVTTTFPANTTVVHDYWYTVVGCQLNDVIAFTATKEDDVIRQITNLCEYAEQDYKTGTELSSIVYPLEGFIFKKLKQASAYMGATRSWQIW